MNVYVVTTEVGRGTSWSARGPIYAGKAELAIGWFKKKIGKSGEVPRSQAQKWYPKARTGRLMT